MTAEIKEGVLKESEVLAKVAAEIEKVEGRKAELIKRKILKKDATGL